ncbi:hypothetical protein Hanom_Chr09g00760981 [Helianthus anomalus]
MLFYSAGSTNVLINWTGYRIGRFTELPFGPVAKLKFFGRGAKTYIPKNFYRTGGGGVAKTYIPTNFYTKTTYITLLSENSGGRAHY